MDTKELEKQGGGLLPVIDKRDYKYTDIFGVAISSPKSVGRLKEILESPLAEQQNLLYQMQLLACVPLHISMLNAYFSLKNDNSLAKVSWPMPYNGIVFYPGRGTSVNECLNFVRKNGQCLDKTFSQDLALAKGEGWVHQKDIVPQEAYTEAENWKIGDYTQVSTDRGILYEALLHTPILLGVNLSNWDDRIIYSPNQAMNHLTLAIEPLDKDNVELFNKHTGKDYKENNFGHFILWEGFRKDKLDLRLFNKNSYIGSAYSFRDIPDTIKIELKKKKFMLRPIKGDQKPEVYFADKIERKHWARRNMSDLYDYAGITEEDIEILPQAQVDAMPEGVPFDMKMVQFWNMTKLYLRRDVLDDEEKKQLGELLGKMLEESN